MSRYGSSMGIDTIAGIIIGSIVYAFVGMISLLSALSRLRTSKKWKRMRKDGALYVLFPLGCFLLAVIWPLSAIMVFFHHFCCGMGNTCCGLNCASWLNDKCERLAGCGT